MNPDALLKHFDQISEAPDAIPRLRRFILALAVRGKLVPQDPKDEPAFKLLESIEKKNKINRDGLKRKPSLPAVDEVSAPFALPSGWAWSRFTDLGIFGRGRSKHRPRNDSCLFEGGTHPLVQTGDVARANGLIQTFTNEYNDEGLAQSAKWPKGTLCITIAANIADSGILDFDACFPDSVVGFIPDSVFPHARYFEYFMRTVKTQLLEFAPATAQKNINLSILNELIIPLPPLAEQQRIVAKVDELMVLCDELEAAHAKRERRRDRLVAASLNSLNNGASADEFRQNASFCLNHLPRLTTRPEHMQQLRQTILNLAVRGKLVPQDPKDEPAPVFLASIGNGKRNLAGEKIIFKSKSSPDIQQKNHPYEIPETWQWVRLGELTVKMTNGIYKPASFYADEGVLCLRMYNIRDGKINFESPKRVLVDDAELKTYELQPGDLLVNRVNSRELVGKAAVIPKTLEKLIFESKNIRVRFINSDQLPKYCSLLFQTAFYRNIIEGYSKQACGQATVSQPQLAVLPVPLPPLAEQERIVAKVDELMAVCAELEARINASVAGRGRLLEAALHEALSGRLDFDH
jgi:type I restriction enzyme, S subunit